MGRERVHFEAPEAGRVAGEMAAFVEWFETDDPGDLVLKASLVHLWFVTIHPFDDGNGRIARALSDMMLARSENASQRFYSMSAQIQKERQAYYAILEKTQKSDMDVTSWILWFLACLHRSIEGAQIILESVYNKTRFWDSIREVAINNRQQLMINKLLDRFEGKLTTAKWAKITKCSHDTALRDIQSLVERGVLLKEEAGGRSTSYVLRPI
jgi:Fic family protein